ncbi:MAG TPA: hypothetical protein VHW47_05625, partial [Acidimicrobiales bacterium]|nr:hypothetical protein [Acidimicrobiales bacterium]
KDGRRWVEVHAEDVNAYIKESAGAGYSAKDFRTWSATILAAAALAGCDPMPTSRSARRRAVVGAVATVAEQLGNTPAVCRSAYVDPRVIDRFEAGQTIGDAVAQLPAPGELGSVTLREAVEEAVVALIGGPDTGDEVAA